jgi:hypothetical protein
VKHPRDQTPYEQDPRSRRLESGIADGVYVFVLDEDDVMHCLPDGPHLHPKILGNASAVKYAGDFRIEAGRICELTNLSGTFLCDDPAGLSEVAATIRGIGLEITAGCVRFFPSDGLQRPYIVE